MNESIESKLENSFIGDNKYYIEIIKGFINTYPKDKTRIFVNDLNIVLRIEELVGDKDIIFTKNTDGNLRIAINKNLNNVRYQDIIIYDNFGVMVERSSCMANLKYNIQENPEILNLEFSVLGENLSGKAANIYQYVDKRKISRPNNYDLNGKYSHIINKYNLDGTIDTNLVEGKFDVLKSGSISALEFPSEDEIKITLEKKYIIESDYEYPNSRSL